MNGVDAVAIATEMILEQLKQVHAYASIGKYKSLSNAFIENEIFYFELKLPLAIGTVGGVTNLHPLVKLASKHIRKSKYS